MAMLELTEQEHEELVSALLDIATGKTYEDTTITQTRGDATVTSNTETARPDKELVMQLLGIGGDGCRIGGPQDYC